jgi:hypothetical protein
VQRKLATKRGHPRTHLWIGDSHAMPGVPNDRYVLLGKMAARLQPEVIWDAGDWWDMNSLAMYDVGKKGWEARRYWLDIEAGVTAMELFENELEKGNFKTKKFRTLGNHEHRQTRMFALEPRYADFVSSADFKSKEYGWSEVPFGTPIQVDGVEFCHRFDRPGGAKPHAGVNWCRNVLLDRKQSCAWGDSHRFGYAEEMVGGSRRILAANVGCYFEHHPNWAGQDVNRWRRGVVVAHNVCDGIFDLDWWSFDRMRKSFG